MEKTIVITEKHCVISPIDNYILNFFNNNFYYKDTSKCYRYGVFNKEFIRYIKFFLEKEKKIIVYSGIYDYIKNNYSNFFNYLQKNYSIIDKRSKIEISSTTIEDISKTFNLRDYQQKIFNNLENNMVIKAPTGAGKTLISLALCFLFLNNNKKILYIAPSKDILKKTSEIAEKYFDKDNIGMTWTNYNTPNKILQFSTPQSVYKNTIENYDVLFIDEVHTATNDFFQKFLKKYKFEFIYGFSATPFTNELNKMKLMQFMGNVFEVENLDNLIENNFLAKPIFYIVDINYPIDFLNKVSLFENKNIAIVDIEKELIANNNIRNEKIVDIAISKFNENKKVLVLTKLLEHNKNLEQIFINKSFNKEKLYFLSGINSLKQRKEVIDKFQKNKDGMILVATQIFKQGVDIPALNVLILADGMSAFHLAIQKTGRVLRVAEGKSEAEIIDFSDKFNSILYKRFYKRLKTYKQIKNKEFRGVD